MVLVIGDAATGVIALINLDTGDVATDPATTWILPSSGSVETSSSSPPLVAPPTAAPSPDLDWVDEIEALQNAQPHHEHPHFQLPRFPFIPGSIYNLDVPASSAPPSTVELPVDAGEGVVLGIAAMDVDVEIAGINDGPVVATAPAAAEDPILTQLQDRLDEEGLSFEDLLTSDDKEFNTLLEELGFASAILRAKMRKAMRALGPVENTEI